MPTLFAFSRLLLVPVLSVCVLAQGISPYPNAITDRSMKAQTPMAPPSVGMVFHDPDFGSSMVRVTDANTNPKAPGSYFRNPAPDANEFSPDNRKFYVSGANTTLLAFGFEPGTMAISSLPGADGGGGLRLPFRAGPTFSYLDSDLMYGTVPKTPLTISTYRFSSGKTSPLFDTTKCDTHPALVAGPKVSSSDLTLSADDNRIQISAGGNQFGSRPFVIVYDKKLGCRWYNTQTGEVGGQWGATGTINAPDRFLVNHSKISGNGQYARVAVGRTGFYIWDIATLNLQPCLYKSKGAKCKGYGSVGYDTYINAPGGVDELNTVRRPLADLADLTPLIDPLPLPHYFGMEKHFAWSNGRVNSNVPICGATYSPTGNVEIKQPYDGEIFCIETDGLASTVWRFAHNRAVWDAEYYWTEPVGNLSLDGRFYIFTSGWDNQVGLDKHGDPRTDVWIIKLD